MTPRSTSITAVIDLGSRTDWQKEVTRTAVSNVHNIRVVGRRTKHAVPFVYQLQESGRGIMKEDRLGPDEHPRRLVINCS